jgi:hypothetical protein
MTSALIFVYRPPSSGQVKVVENDAPHAAAPGDTTVPKPIMASPCWAEARLARAKNVQTVATKTNFLKRNLP